MKAIKHTIQNISALTFAGMILMSPQSSLIAQTAEQSSITTSTTSAGTISQFSPETIIIKSETSSEPVRYTHTKTTTYVDETGAPVSVSVVKSGVPVTVFYVKDGDTMVASKVVLKSAASVVVPAPAEPLIENKKTSTTITTEEL